MSTVGAFGTGNDDLMDTVPGSLPSVESAIQDQGVLKGLIHLAIELNRVR